LDGTRGRYAEVDYLKAVGILGVILIHSFAAPWDAGATAVDKFLGHMTAFSVPAFVAASGFLYAATTSNGLAATARRLRRLLVPYLVASLCAQAYRTVWPIPFARGSLLSDLVFGASFGIYYYVFVAFWLILATPVIARIPRAYSGLGLAMAIAATLVFQQMHNLADSSGLSVFAYQRNPLLFIGYFAVGWYARLNYASLVRWLVPRRRIVVAILAMTGMVCAGLFLAPIPQAAAIRVHDLATFLVIALIFAEFCGHAGTPSIVRTLSDASYAIYLFHPFFVFPVRQALAPGATWAIAASFCAGLTGALATIAVARVVLRRYARPLLGA
jgi:peptidoglycan/LPS O-acetylase OafA/YrhL